MISQCLPLANVAMHAHIDHLPVKPKYFFTKTERPDQDGSIATKKGSIRIAKGTFPVSKSNSSPFHVTILTFASNIARTAFCPITLNSHAPRHTVPDLTEGGLEVNLIRPEKVHNLNIPPCRP